MKTLKESLFDTDLASKDIIYHPKTKKELRSIIEKELEIQGPDANLNHIDVSKITDMSALFENLDIKNIDISLWDVRKVKDMAVMFNSCENFNCNLSNWDVRNVKDMSFMFFYCLNFTGEGLEKWNVNRANILTRMFEYCNSLKNIPDWYKKYIL